MKISDEKKRKEDCSAELQQSSQASQSSEFVPGLECVVLLVPLTFGSQLSVQRGPMYRLGRALPWKDANRNSYAGAKFTFCLMIAISVQMHNIMKLVSPG